VLIGQLENAATLLDEKMTSLKLMSWTPAKAEEEQGYGSRDNIGQRICPSQKSTVATSSIISENTLIAIDH
jgi:hypothetical protein